MTINSQIKEQFLKVYANLPLGVRKEIILVLANHGPITWDVAYVEVTNDTALSKIILIRLQELEII